MDRCLHRTGPQTGRKGTWLMSYRDLTGYDAVAVGEFQEASLARGSAHYG